MNFNPRDTKGGIAAAGRKGLFYAVRDLEATQHINTRTIVECLLNDFRHHKIKICLGAFPGETGHCGRSCVSMDSRQPFRTIYLSTHPTETSSQVAQRLIDLYCRQILPYSRKDLSAWYRLNGPLKTYWQAILPPPAPV